MVRHGSWLARTAAALTAAATLFGFGLPAWAGVGGSGGGDGSGGGASCPTDPDLVLDFTVDGVAADIWDAAPSDAKGDIDRAGTGWGLCAGRVSVKYSKKDPASGTGYLSDFTVNQDLVFDSYAATDATGKSTELFANFLHEMTPGTVIKAGTEGHVFLSSWGAGRTYVGVTFGGKDEIRTGLTNDSVTDVRGATFRFKGVDSYAKHSHDFIRNYSSSDTTVVGSDNNGDTAVDAPTPDPTRKGYSFDGWYTDPTGGDKVSDGDDASKLDPEQDFYAHWSKAVVVEHTVSFDSDGGSPVPSQKVNDGDAATRPADPSKTGYTFDDWYENPSDSTPYAFGDPVTGDITLHAKWTKDSGSGSGGSGSGDGSTDKPGTGDGGSDGGTGDGSTDKPGTGDGSDKGDGDGSGSTDKPGSGDGGDSGSTDKPGPGDGDGSGSTDKPGSGDGSDKGDGDGSDSTDKGDGSGSTDKPDATVEHTVTFESNGGSEVKPVKVKDGATFTQPTDPTRTGYSFSGWYDDPVFRTPHDFTLAVRADLTLYAKWTASPAGGDKGDGKDDGTTTTPDTSKTYTVTFDPANGDKPTSVKVKGGNPVKAPATPTRDGYRFTGWYEKDAKTAYDFTAPVAGDLTLTAKWSKLDASTVTHVIRFESNGGSAIPDMEVKDGSIATAPANPTRDGYVFAGWYVDKELTTPFDFSTPVVADATAYAKWTEAKKATHTVVIDDGTGHKTTVVVDPDGTIPLPADPKRDGYRFDGWVDQNGQPVTKDTKVTDDLYVTAKWTPVTASTISKETVDAVADAVASRLPQTGVTATIIIGATLMISLGAIVTVIERRRG